MDEEQWVVVTFGGADEALPIGWMDALLPAEMAAVEALETSGLGYIDGNEIGDHGYELYFVGSDRHAVWGVLEPELRDAPVPWTRVELRTHLEDVDPIVLVRDS